MRLENVQNSPKNNQNGPKNVENQANWPKNIQKVRKLLQNFFSGQKPWDFTLKSYCWSFPASHTIFTSGFGSLYLWHKVCRCADHVQELLSAILLRSLNTTTHYSCMRVLPDVISIVTENQDEFSPQLVVLLVRTEIG